MVRKALSTHGEGCCNTLKDCSPCLCCSLYLQTRLFAVPSQATFVAYSTGIENSDKGKSLAPCGNLLPLHAQPYALIAVLPHIVLQRGIPVTFELTSAPNSSLTEAILPYILASLKCTLLDKVKIHFPFVCSLTVHIAIRKKGGFRSRDAGRSGGLFRRKKGKYPFSNP